MVENEFIFCLKVLITNACTENYYIMYKVFKLRLIIVIFLYRSVYNTSVKLLYVCYIFTILKSKPIYFNNSWLSLIEFLNGSLKITIKIIFNANGIHYGRTINTATVEF